MSVLEDGIWAAVFAALLSSRASPLTLVSAEGWLGFSPAVTTLRPDPVSPFDLGASETTPERLCVRLPPFRAANFSFSCRDGGGDGGLPSGILRGRYDEPDPRIGSSPAGRPVTFTTPC